MLKCFHYSVYLCTLTVPTLPIISPLCPPLMSSPAISPQWQANGSADLAGWNIPLSSNECRRHQTGLDWASDLNINEDHSLIRAVITHKSLCCRSTHIMFVVTHPLLCALCTCLLLTVCVCVCRSVWRCCAVTVNKISRGGISVIAPFMMWQLMTAKIYLKTSVSGLLCERLSVCVCVYTCIYALKTDSAF